MLSVYVCLKLLKQVFGNLISCPLFEWSVTWANQASIPISQSDYLYKKLQETYKNSIFKIWQNIANSTV